MLLESASAADPAAAAGAAAGSFLAALAASGPVGALIAAALGALVVISGSRLYHTLRNPQPQPQVPPLARDLREQRQICLPALASQLRWTPGWQP